MISFFHCTLFAALALLSVICIKPTHAAPRAPDPPVLGICSDSLSPPSTWSSEKEIFTLPGKHGDDERSRNLTLFKQSSLSLLDKDQFLSFKFTSDADAHPRLAFILVRFSQSASPISMQSTMKLPLPCNPPLRALCDNQPQLQIPPPDCSSEQDPNDSSETEVSLKYEADAAELQVQAVDYAVESEFHTTVTFSINISQSDAAGPTVSNESTMFFVGYITASGEATISNVIKDDDNAKSNHKKVLVGVIVGVSMIVIFVALLVLVLFITKLRGRPSPISSRPIGHVAPSTPSRAPFPYHDLESSPTPMMRALPLSPPYKTDAFQISGTASWLKQPNAR